MRFIYNIFQYGQVSEVLQIDLIISGLLNFM